VVIGIRGHGELSTLKRGAMPDMVAPVSVSCGELCGCRSRLAWFKQISMLEAEFSFLQTSVAPVRISTPNVAASVGGGSCCFSRMNHARESIRG
jgi:hypothetical protein